MTTAADPFFPLPACDLDDAVALARGFPVFALSHPVEIRPRIALPASAREPPAREALDFARP